MGAQSSELACRQCHRLANHLKQVRGEYPDYHALPVLSFGAADPGLLVVGLAPGMHGANASGRPFTGDYAGRILYKALYKNGFSNQEKGVSIDDGLQLHDCRITNAVRCLPPANKPTAAEVRQCNQYLRTEITSSRPVVILALGGIAHRSVLLALALRAGDYPFGHGKSYRFGSRWLLDSYHCSRYNIHTRRLSEEMFLRVVSKARRLVDEYRCRKQDNR